MVRTKVEDMKKFKDINNNVHGIEEGFESLLPVSCTEISDAEAESLSIIAAQPSDIDAQINSELGTDAIRVIVETLVPMIQDGSIISKTPNEVIAQAKANRRAEL